ncbi:hypothetical protein R6Q59_027758 [Mikania micrantha]
MITDIHDEHDQAVCDVIGPSNSIYVHCGVTNEEDVNNTIDTAITTYGKLDIIVDVKGVFLGMKHVATFMVPAKTGSIISMSSLASIVAGDTLHAYCCTKHVVVCLTKNLAAELGQFSIRVNCLSPHAWTPTPLTKSYIGLQAEAIENEIHLTGNLKGMTCLKQMMLPMLLFS